MWSLKRKMPPSSDFETLYICFPHILEMLLFFIFCQTWWTSYWFPHSNPIPMQSLAYKARCSHCSVIQHDNRGWKPPLKHNSFNHSYFRYI